MLVNKTPAELDVGTASDTSVVHASENNVSTNSKGHNQRDISRLQGTTPTHSAAKSYNENDLVCTVLPNHDSPVVYRATENIPVEAFDPLKWEAVALPASFEDTAALLDDADVFISEGSPIVPRKTNVRDISRLQGTCPNYSSSKTYNINDIVEESDNVYRCTVAIGTPETFDRSKWSLVWDTLDVVRVFTQADLPDVVTGFIPLEDGKDYRFTQSINLANPLFLPVGGTVALTSESKHAVIIDTDGVNFVSSRNNYAAYTIVADSGGDLLFTVPTLGNAFDVGDLINIETLTGTDYSQIKATILTTPSATTFTIAGSFAATGTGNIDGGCLNVLVTGLNVNNLNPTGGITAFDINMTRAQQSFLEVTNNRVQNFLQVGPLTNANELYFEHNKIFSNIDAVKIIRCEVVNVADCYFEAAIASLKSLEIAGEGIMQHCTISNCTFKPTAAAFAAILVDPTDMSDTASVSVFNCIDLNIDNNTLFDTDSGGLDESDPRLTVRDNVRQKDGIACASLGLIGSPTSDFEFAISSSNTPADCDDTGDEPYVMFESQRFSLSDADIGEVTYDGLEDIEISVSFNGSVRSQNSTDFMFLQLAKDIGSGYVQIPNSRVYTTVIDIAQFLELSNTFVMDISNGDKIKLQCGNFDNTDDMEASNIAFTIVRIR